MSFRTLTLSSLTGLLLTLACAGAAEPDATEDGGVELFVVKTSAQPGEDTAAPHGGFDISGLDRDLHEHVALPIDADSLRISLPPGAYGLSWTPDPVVDESGVLRVTATSRQRVIVIAPGQVATVNVHTLELLEASAAQAAGDDTLALGDR